MASAHDSQIVACELFTFGEIGRYVDRLHEVQAIALVFGRAVAHIAEGLQSPLAFLHQDRQLTKLLRKHAVDTAFNARESEALLNYRR